MRRVYIGLDLHSTQATVHQIIMEDDGSIDRSSSQYRMEKLESAFIDKLTSECAVCVEASTGAHSLSRMIVAKGARAFEVDPLKMPVIFNTGKKTDRVDAKKLADTLRMHLEHDDPHDGFPEVYVPDVDTQRLRMLLAHYQQLNAEIVSLKNKMYAMFRQWLVHVDKGMVIENLETYLKQPRLPPEVEFIAKQLKAQHEQFQEQKDAIRQRIETIGVLRYPEEVRLPVSISGVSVFGAVVIMSDIITISRFRSAKKLTSYLRAASRVDASNKTVHNGHLNKAGRKMSFEVLLQGVNHLIAGNPFFSAYRDRSVGKPANKIRATLVARTIKHIFYILKNRELNYHLSQANFLKKEREVERLIDKRKSA